MKGFLPLLSSDASIWRKRGSADREGELSRKRFLLVTEAPAFSASSSEDTDEDELLVLSVRPLLPLHAGEVLVLPSPSIHPEFDSVLLLHCLRWRYSEMESWNANKCHWKKKTQFTFFSKQNNRKVISYTDSVTVLPVPQC